MEQTSATTRTPMKKSSFSKLLLPHENALLEIGALCDITHKNSSSVWLHAESTVLREGEEKQTMALVYRPMGDLELMYLVSHGVLPSTQPYQAIIEGQEGRAYSEKYLTGAKKVDSSPTTVVEFKISRRLVETLMSIQCKPEDGVMSMGLGDKAGGGLPLFNAFLSEHCDPPRWKIVKVKRRISVEKERSGGKKAQHTNAKSKK